MRSLLNHELLHHIKGCIFDFDGTIIVSEHVHMKAWEDLAQDIGQHLPDGFLDQSVGMSDLQLIKILGRAWNDCISQDEILHRKRAFYMRRCPIEASVVPGVTSLISALHGRGVPIAIATSSSREEVNPVLHRLGLTGLFDGICTVEDVVHPKPDPEIYLCAAARLHLRTDQCLAFEDSIAGVESARRAGCALITVQTLYEASKLGPAILSVRNFEDSNLLQMIKIIGR